MSDERFYLGNNGTTICDRNQGGSDGFNMLTKFEVVDLLNRQDFAIEVKQKYIEKLEKQLEQIPKSIREVWLE